MTDIPRPFHDATLNAWRDVNNLKRKYGKITPLYIIKIFLKILGWRQRLLFPTKRLPLGILMTQGVECESHCIETR